LASAGTSKSIDIGGFLVRVLDGRTCAMAYIRGRPAATTNKV
jgi:hypothetical protein